MNRLTKLSELSDVASGSKYEANTNWNDPMSIRNGANKIYEAIDKLGQLEDIEDELGIDLVTLFKALKDGIWSTEFWYCESPNCKERIKFIYPDIQHYEIDGKKHWSFDCGDGGYYTVEFADYGKTWSFTKEELK